MSTQFNNALKKIKKLDDWLAIKDWNIPKNTSESIQERFKKLERESIQNQIWRLQKYQQECKNTIDDKVYTSPFASDSQEKLKISKKDQRETQVEYNRISKTITYLQDILLEMPL